jgi:Leucine-rich repeat (LRR) protein
LSELNNLSVFNCSINRLTETIPSLSANTGLAFFSCASNQLTGTIPSLSELNNLEFFSCWSNQLRHFAGGSVSNTLGDFKAQNNQLRATSVNSILAAFVAAGRTTGTPILNGTCILNLGGTTNSRPTGQGVTDVTTLRNRGWTVTTGTALL